MSLTSKDDTSESVLSESPESMEKIVGMLLEVTKSKISEGSKDDALATLLHAIRLSSGEDSIIRILDQAKKKAEEDATMQDQEAADCLSYATNAIEKIQEEDCFLSQRGEEDILKDAFQDGSSLICQKCGGLVKAERWEAHSDSWCPALEGASDSDEESIS
mmetsp:Transcript_28801/g.27584  ORF Transcript_28801/g.27584 Transcript_28801/m.27584 type:complete len:161 (-) Transcript_28801:692-1174(-)